MNKNKIKKSSTTGGIIQGYEDSSAPGPIKEDGQHSSYWVLSEEERDKGFVRPLRDAYIHTFCRTETRINSDAIVETYARDPKYYGSTFCMFCKGHFSVDQFLWTDTTEIVGS